MNITEFADFFALTAEERQFIIRFDFENIAGELTKIPETLHDDFILRQLGKLRRPENANLILQGACELKSDPYLLAGYNYLCYYWWKHPQALLYGHKLPDFENSRQGSENAGIYNLLVVLAGFPAVENSYARLKLPEHYAQDTLQYTSGAITEYAAGHDNKLGIGSRKAHWFRFYVNGVLFRIGRFEYMMQDPQLYLPAAYKRNSDGKVIALCRHNWLLSKDGLRLFENDSPEKAYKTAQLQTNDSTISGIPINPNGYAQVDRKITLDLNEYTPLWSSWDLVPGLHIPGGGGMTPEAAAASLREALEFFPRYFGRKVAAISCFSWIFNNDFEELLPESNLTKLMQQLYLFPFASVGVEGLTFVFGRNEEDWKNFPADNSLRRAFHKLHEQNRRLKAGGMFITPEAINNFGQSTFRKDYPSFDDL